MESFSRVRDQRSFEKRLIELAQEYHTTAGRVRDLLSSVVIAQTLPRDSFLKGGMSIKFQVGDHQTRATADIDAATNLGTQKFLTSLQENLERGWGTCPLSRAAIKRGETKEPTALTGRLKSTKVHNPGDTNPDHLAMRIEIGFELKGKGVMSQTLDLARDKMSMAAKHHRAIELHPTIRQMIESSGFGKVEPFLPFIPTEQQIAQKCHAFQSEPVQRSYDLIDLQVIANNVENGVIPFELGLARQIVRRTFEFRPDLELKPFNASTTIERLTKSEFALAESRYSDRVKEVRLKTGIRPDFESACNWFDEYFNQFL